MREVKIDPPVITFQKRNQVNLVWSAPTEYIHPVFAMQITLIKWTDMDMIKANYTATSAILRKNKVVFTRSFLTFPYDNVSYLCYANNENRLTYYTAKDVPYIYSEYLELKLK